MGIMQITIFGILGILGNLPVTCRHRHRTDLKSISNDQEMSSPNQTIYEVDRGIGRDWSNTGWHQNKTDCRIRRPITEQKYRKSHCHCGCGPSGIPVIEYYSCMFGASCNYPCHCQNNDMCDPVDGSCPAGCDDGELGEPGDYLHTGAWTGYGCQLGNVAYNKTATHGPDQWWFPPGRAIDGNHDPDMYGGESCVWPWDDDKKILPWWQVDLGDTYVIISVNITYRNTEQDRAVHVNITVGNHGDDDSAYQICHEISDEGAVNSNYVTCDARRVGRFVRFQRLPSGYDAYELTLCEVQVYGYLYHDCPEGYFDVACGSPCNCRGPCDNINGNCSTGDCLAGWMDDNCQTVCPAGSWGDECQETCNCQDVFENCISINGSCASGCNNGYGGVGCNLELPGLHSLSEFSSATHNTLTIRFNNWTPENGGGTQPRGYLIETRLNGSMEWIPGPQIDHDATVIVYTLVLKSLEPHTYYYVRVTPFIEDGGYMYYGTATQEAGPFLTLEVESMTKSTITTTATAVIVGVVMACVLVTISIVVVVMFVRCRRTKRSDSSKSVSTNTAMPQGLGAVSKGSEGVTSTTEYASHVYESIEEENAVLPEHNDEYENLKPNIGGLSQRNEVFVSEPAHGPGVSSPPAEEGYESLAPIASGVDTKYETIGGRANFPVYSN